MQNKKTTKIYEERNLSGELEKKIKYARSGVLTDQKVIGKMMRYIADLSFADFMFFKREAFQNARMVIQTFLWGRFVTLCQKSFTRRLLPGKQHNWLTLCASPMILWT